MCDPTEINIARAHNRELLLEPLEGPEELLDASRWGFFLGRLSIPSFRMGHRLSGAEARYHFLLPFRGLSPACVEREGNVD